MGVRLLEFLERHGRLVEPKRNEDSTIALTVNLVVFGNNDDAFSAGRIERSIVYGKELTIDENTINGRVLWRNPEFYEEVERSAKRAGRDYLGYLDFSEFDD